MAFKNRKKIWRFLKKFLYPATTNQVGPVINVQENNFVHNPNEIETETSEIVSIVVIDIQLFTIIIMLTLAKALNFLDTMFLRNVLFLIAMASTHISWIVISEKLRHYTKSLVTNIQNWWIGAM